MKNCLLKNSKKVVFEIMINANYTRKMFLES